MKVLNVAWVIYDSRLEKFSKNCTGGGLVIKNLCNFLGKKIESYLFVGQFFFPEIILDNFTIVDTIKYQTDDCLKDKTKHFNQMLKAFSNALKSIKPDIVNFQGIGEFAIYCMDICERLSFVYVYTEHLFLPRKKLFSEGARSLEWEQILYSRKDLKIIAVSSGMKKNILIDFPFINKKNIKVILNGTDFKPVLCKTELEDRYKKNRKLLLCVGSVCSRKNQMQLVSSFKLLNDELKNNIVIIFCGNDRLDSHLQNTILENKLENSLFYVGALSSEDIKKYYSICNGLVMPSLAEGLSIAALETIAYGQPVIMFRDSECAEDLNDDKVCVFAEERTDQSLADAIEKWYFNNWDTEYIKKYSEYFSMERMADDYITYYKKMITGRGK